MTDKEYKIEIWKDEESVSEYFIQSSQLKKERHYETTLFTALNDELSKVFPRKVRICRLGWGHFETEVNHRIISLEDSYNLISKITRDQLREK